MLTFFVDNSPVGAAILMGGETHLSIEPEYHGRWLTPKALRELRNALVRCPRATVRTDNAIARRFVERFGMTLVSDSNGWAKYESPPRTA
jgi:ribosomal protein S18 acetylase RimI-like enzyme